MQKGMLDFSDKENMSVQDESCALQAEIMNKESEMEKMTATHKAAMTFYQSKYKELLQAVSIHHFLILI
jgi:ABC-type Fe3+-citrate transport system substrate-binding protein